MFRAFTLLTLVVLLGSGCAKQPSVNKTTSPTVPAGGRWQPDEALLGQLAGYTDIGDYQVCSPRGYSSASNVPMQPSLRNFTWVGPQRSDGTMPQFQVILVSPPLPELSMPLQKFMTIDLQSMK